MFIALTQIRNGEKRNAKYNRKEPQSVLLWWNSSCYRIRGGSAFVALNLKILFGTIILFLLNQFFLKPLTSNIVVQSYFNDALAMGILLPYANLLLALFPGRDIRLLRSLPILAFTISAGIFWEFVTPLYLARSFSDQWDLVAYLIGGAVVCKIISNTSRQLGNSESDPDEMYARYQCHHNRH